MMATGEPPFPLVPLQVLLAGTLTSTSYSPEAARRTKLELP